MSIATAGETSRQSGDIAVHAIGVELFTQTDDRVDYVVFSQLRYSLGVIG